MTPKMIWANLTVSDLDRTTKFYTQLGFKPNGAPNAQLTSFVVGKDDFVIHFFLKQALEANMNVRMADAHSDSEVMFTLSAESKEDADAWAEEVAQAGGTIVSQPAAFGDGYSGFVFADPDGHQFNVFCRKA